MKFHSLIGFLMVFIFSSCSSRVQKPDPLLSQSQMVDLLTEMQLTEAVLQQYQANHIDSIRFYTNTTYDALFKKYGLNQESFEANMYYRTYHSKDLEKIYSEVFQNLHLMDSIANAR